MIQTLAEVAAELKVTERWLRDFIRREQIAVLRSGRIVRFDAAAKRELEDAMRVKPRASLRLAVDAVRTQPRGRAARPQGKSAYDEVLEMTAAALRKKKRS
jgi:hypothetical protein